MMHESNYDGVTPREFDDCYVVLLRPHPHRKEPQTDAERDLLQQTHLAHLGHLKDLVVSGKAVTAGPFTDGTGGIIIIKGSAMTFDEAQAIMENDPAVIAKRFVIQIHPLKTPKGQLIAQ